MGKTALLFPGQGAQHIGMGKTIAEKYPAAKALYDQANEILGYDLAKLCFEGPAEELNTTAISQPALYVTSLACLEMVKAEQPEILENYSSLAGLSLGEYTALHVAGAFSFEDGLKIVDIRGRAMQEAAEATPSGMVSLLLLAEDQVQEVCDQASSAGSLQIANYLCKGNIVVSGEKAACEKAVELGEAAGGRAIPLTVAGAFHTDIMKPADDKLAAGLADVALSTPSTPVISNVDASAHMDPEELKSLLVKQVLSPVRWEASMKVLLEDGYDTFYEIGPGKVLKGLMKRINRKVTFETLNDS